MLVGSHDSHSEQWKDAERDQMLGILMFLNARFETRYDDAGSINLAQEPIV